MEKLSISSFRRPRRASQRGNAVVMLFAAIGMAGVVTYGLNNVMRGPAVTTAELSRRTIAENNLVAATRLGIVTATKNQPNGGDCDGDGFVEPLPFRTGSPAPTGGGLLPLTMGASLSDPWGNQYGYCVWDPGTLNKSDNVAACGGAGANRLDGGPRDDKPAIAVISAGKNGAFETTCNAFVDNSTVMVNKPAASDDIVLSYTYAEANGIGAGEWQVKPSDPATAQVGKNLEVRGGASLMGALDARQGGLQLPKDPGDDSVTGPCDAAKDQQMRLNMASDPPALEICNMAGTGWTAVSGGGAAAAAPDHPSCIFPNITKIAEVDTADRMIVTDQYLYGTRHDGLISVWNYSDTAPGTSKVSDFAPPYGRAYSIIEGNLIYTATWNNDAVWIAEVSNPSNVVLRGAVTSASLLDGAGTLAKHNNHLVVNAPGRVTMVDVSNPASPTISGSVADPTYLFENDSLVISGNYAVVASRGSNSLTTVSLANPAAPTVVNHLTDNTRLEEVSEIVKFDNYVIAISMYSSAPYMTTVDITNPVSPTIVATKNFPAEILSNDTRMRLYGKYLFMTGSTSGKVTIFDLSNPADIIVVGTIPNVANWDDFGGVRGHYYQTQSATNDKDDVFDLGCDPLTGEITAVSEEAQNTTPDPLDTGMIAYWPMDDAAGTTVADATGNGYSATFVNTPQWLTDGPIGSSALSFNGTDRDALQIPGLLGGPATSTVALWVNSEETDTSGSDLFSIGDNIILRLTAARLQLVLWSGSNHLYTTASYPITSGGWHHIAATIDDPNNIFRLYIDGQLVWADTHNISLPFTGQGSDTFIGRNGNGVTSYDFTGALDDVRVYNRALGPIEVRRLYERSRATSTSGSQAAAAASVPSDYNKISSASLSAQVCAIKSDASLWCWGNPAYGETGGATPGVFDTPGRVGTGRWQQVSTAPYVTCGIMMDGTLWCWGYNGNGELGIGVNGGQRNRPTRVGNDNRWTQLSSGDVSCAVRSDSTLWCWGRNHRAQLGQGNFTDSNVPVQVAGSWSSIGAGGSVSCGVKTDGTGWCWGLNDNGRTGIGTASGYQTTPAQISDPGPWKQVVGGFGATSCGIKMDGSAWCWGSDLLGRLGNGSRITGDQSKPSPVESLRRFTSISVGNWGVCALATDGSAWCWGEDNNGVLGNGATITVEQHSPTRVIGPDNWTTISTGSVTCGLRSDMSAWCWGSDGYNSLGNGLANTTAQHAPFMVSNFILPSAIGWGEDQAYLVANSAYNLALAGGRMSFGAAYFGFNGPGNAELAQPADNNQLLIETTATSSAAQLSFRTGNGNALGDVNSSQVSRWQFNETSGTTAADLGGRNGTLLGTPGWAPDHGWISGALSFNGSSDAVEVANNAALRPATFTVTVWVKPDPSQNAVGKIISKTHSNNGSPIFDSYALQIEGGNAVFATGHSGEQRKLTAPMPASGWTMLTGVYNPGGAAPQKKLFVNGVLVASETLTTAIAYDTAAASGKLFFGRNGAGGDYYRGLMDDVRLMSAAYDNGMVAQMYAFAAGQKQTPRTIGVNPSNDRLYIGRNNASVSTWTDALTPDLSLDASGALGIGQAAPAAKVDVLGGVRIGADQECSTSAHAGKVRYIATESPPWKYCNGTAWTAFPSTAITPWRPDQQAISINAGPTCAIKADGSAWCWGDNQYGAIGDNSTTLRRSPVKVNDNSSSTGWNDWQAIAVQSQYPPDLSNFTATCGLRANGTVWCWGLADNGRLGINSDDPDRARPVQVHTNSAATGWTDWTQVTGGDMFFCGLRANGTIWCWGGGENGRLGNNSGTDRFRPVSLHSSSSATAWTDWIQIESGGESSCGLRSNGTLWCWGEATAGQLGDNQTSSPAMRPKQVLDSAGGAGWSDWVKVSKGWAHACGIRADGSVWCWGSDYDGELGRNGAGGVSALPVRVRTSTNGTGWNDWIEISAGTAHTCGIRVDGSAWCWGENPALGNNSYSPSYVPTQVRTDANGTGWTDWTAIRAGNNYSCGSRSNGTLWCWGDDNFSRFGQGGSSDVADQLLPMQVPAN